MKSHKIQPPKLYETMPQEPDPIYPYITLPEEIFDKDEYQPGHKCMLKIEVEIEMMDKNSYQCKLLRSEELESKAEEKAEGE